LTSFIFCTGIDLENIVYYRDNTHYFVMTAKKQSLLDKGVIINVSCAFWRAVHEMPQYVGVKKNI